jgi:hypothetical protein
MISTTRCTTTKYGFDDRSKVPSLLGPTHQQNINNSGCNKRTDGRRIIEDDNNTALLSAAAVPTSSTAYYCSNDDDLFGNGDDH